MIFKSILQFHCDEEALAWRTIGLAARAAVELGLHRRDTYLCKFSDSQQRLWANKLFWCIYILDRRWSFGTGLPFALHDDDIDPDLPEQVRTMLTSNICEAVGLISMRRATRIRPCSKL
jgi:Fungal specific transcription factor domain